MLHLPYQKVLKTDVSDWDFPSASSENFRKYKQATSYLVAKRLGLRGNMASKYYLTTGKDKLGPLSEADIIKAVRSGKISMFDMILNNQTNEWMMLAQHPDFSDLDSSQAEEEEISEDSDHFAIGLLSDKADNSNGLDLPEFITPDNFPILTPVYWYEKDKAHQKLKYLDVLSLVHSHKLTEQSLISNSAQGPWQPLIKWEEFSAESLKSFKDASHEALPDVHIRRQTKRFNAGLVFTALTKKGKGFQIFCPDISKGGLAFLVRAAKCDLKEEIMIKFSDNLQDGRFDAKGVIVSIRKAKLPGADDIYVRYGVRFTALSEQGKKYILKITG